LQREEFYSFNFKLKNKKRIIDSIILFLFED